ncbi:MAG: GNAT family N-acetyltransferase [Clostridia bacterium]|nr:GNAT family N-acetyltransferase [Clostridia bacterium]
MILETNRLYLREMTQEDFSDLAEMLQDPEVMYAYEHDFSDEDVQVWLDRQRMRYAKYGFGLWAMILKESGEMIGQAGLTMQPYRGGEVLEIGYLLKKKHWHNGYAREAAEGCKKYAFETLGAPKVHSVIKADNFASQRVAESVGLRKEDEFVTQYYNGDMLHFLYSLEK